MPDFIPTKLEEERAKEKGTTFTIYLNEAEYEQLKKDMIVLEQKKDSTAIKQLWLIGSNLLHDQKTGLIIRTLFINKRRNKRLGISDFE